jgi:hypothetical protein
MLMKRPMNNEKGEFRIERVCSLWRRWGGEIVALMGTKVIEWSKRSLIWQL